jgi:fluoride exporter
MPAVMAVVTVGGAAGAVTRHLLSGAFTGPEGSFPWLVLMINVVGSGLLAALPALPGVRSRPLLPPLLGTGFLGGFTTMSTYSVQTRALLAGGHPVTATLYVLGTLAAALLAVAVADRLSSPADRAEFDAEEGDL